MAHENNNYLKAKRICDVFLAYVLLLLLYVPMIFIALSIKITSPGPVIFRQIRIGEGGKRCMCYKFRTMKSDAPHNLSTAEFVDSERYITSVGRFLRRSSLDELPQLFNVLAGDMSLVGPRPLIPEESEMHKKREELGAYRVKPGITGLAQIMGRDTLSDDEKAECDGIYAEEVCFSADVKIVFFTFFKVCTADGIKESSDKTADQV